MIDISTDKFPAAIARLAGKTPVASKLRTAEWQRDVPDALRDRALFSAAVDDLNTIQAMGDKLDEWANFIERDPSRAFMDRSKFISEMRQGLGAVEGDTGDLTDITSGRRLGLIYDFQTQDAAEFGRWKIGQDPDVLDAFPAQEFTRIESRIHPREDWTTRWVSACEAAGDEDALRVFRSTGRMIALKTSQVWVKLSRFGRPWPPFDFGSGMGLEDIGRDEAEQLGLIAPGATVPGGPSGQDFNDGLNASVSHLGEALASKLTEWFGDQVKIEGGVASWTAA